ncbi:2Fe-2S ferredoxin [Williamsia limnetica]|uniref:2Fe-2S iron-sulfur cluster-binding protein n=2 Tax=Mycobacteriales TaxID=85007 RepID=A0ABT4MZL9_GORRU|nr:MULTISPECIES: 2Fe-2S iron-sulfur cluster-binding protein [Mycobacteriales]MCZ4552453.1 2Fe-2S iron-sulfur cluster-binding protein [Gordonia rubripertincta]PYE19321.1 2Fe-2S ferredoxin [Williamsia limnetica]
MPIVTYVDDAGEAQEIDGQDGDSVMETAVTNGVSGIVGQCGGSLACATCHVYIHQSWRTRTGSASELEEEMLEGALAEHRPESRLSCQIVLDDSLDGLTVTVAPDQL